MSQFYKPNRNPKWNYGGDRWRLSRSKIDLFMNCKRCFYIDNKLGVARPPMFPFNLNSAVDHLLKKEFDIYRAKGEAHPIMEEADIKMIPLKHAKLDIWRENFKGVDTLHAPTGFTVSGAVDDLWLTDDGKVVVVDYKATSKDDDISELDQDWHDGYKRQMEIYQWLLRQNGLSVSDTGYFVYANGDKDKDRFDAKLEFKMTLIPYIGDANWIDGELLNIKECLDQDLIPKNADDCDYCTYRGAVGTVLKKGKGEGDVQPTLL